VTVILDRLQRKVRVSGMRKDRMPQSKWWLPGVTWMAVLILTGCDGAVGPVGPQGPEGPSAALPPCVGCHNDETIITAKTLQWEQSKHAWGGNYVMGTSATCAGCHSSEGFTDRIAAGLQPDEVTAGEPSPTPIKCRTCHQTHTTYTTADWELTTREPVTLMVSGATYDSGAGNLCANCHQPRQAPPEVGAGEVEITSGDWNAHRTQAATLLGVGGYGETFGAGTHQVAVEDGCVTCHMGPDRIHTKEAQLAACQTCHGGLDTFDRNGVQTRMRALYDELEGLLLANGILLSDGQAKVGTYPEEVAGAFWNYQFVRYDRSWGVHNPSYIRLLLQASIDALK